MLYEVITKAAIDDIAKLLYLQFDRAKVVYRLDDQTSEKILVHGYENEFKQVILNILTNAKDSILERSQSSETNGGEVTVILHQEKA